MAKKPKRDIWAEIKAAFAAGEAVHAIAKRFEVGIAEILSRAKKEGWKRTPEPEPPKPEKPKASVTALPVVYQHKPFNEAVDEAVAGIAQEAAADIVREHRERTRTQRDTYDKLHAEFQSMMLHLVSFSDAETLAKMRDGNPADRVKLLIDLLKATGIKFSMFERLTLMLREIIALEREVWGLNETEGADNMPQWDELLALATAPSTMRPLPGVVLDFEKRLADRE